MPNSETAKTKSAHKARKRVLWASALVVSLITIIALPVLLIQSSRPRSDQQLATPNKTTYRLSIAGSRAGEQAGQPSAPKSRAYYLNPVTTRQTIEKGLGGTPSLASDRGMLFIYPSTAERCFWMKNMRYSLDIIWADETKKITAIEHDVAPETYPRTFCHMARYVIELNAGEAAKTGFEQGQALNF